MGGNQHGEGYGAGQKERRAHARFALNEESLLVLVAHGVSFNARVIDLSLEGCRVRTNDRFTGKAGRQVEVCFKVKGFAFRFSGVVQWFDGQQTLGVHFVNMIPRRKAELAEVIEEMAATVAARAKAAGQRAAEPAPASSERPEFSPPVSAGSGELADTQANRLAGAAAKSPSNDPPLPKAKSWLAAAFGRRRAETPCEASPPAAMAGEAPEPGIAAPAELEAEPRRPSKPRDRRVQARHEVDTTAIILLVNVASQLRGRIVDLSVSGCRIRSDERFPVGIYTRIEVEFYLQGLPFRLGGVIQAIHGRDTVGIRFLDLSDRKRKQVLDLIDEIEQMRAETAARDAAATSESA